MHLMSGPVYRVIQLLIATALTLVSTRLINRRNPQQGWVISAVTAISYLAAALLSRVIVGHWSVGSIPICIGIAAVVSTASAYVLPRKDA
jgi:hypothetical protein